MCAFFLSLCSWLYINSFTTSSFFFPLALCFLPLSLPLSLSVYLLRSISDSIVPWSPVPPDPTFLNLYLWDTKPWLMRLHVCCTCWLLSSFCPSHICPSPPPFPMSCPYASLVLLEVSSCLKSIPCYCCLFRGHVLGFCQQLENIVTATITELNSMENRYCSP